METNKIAAALLSDCAERTLARLIDATVAGTFSGVFTPTEVARVLGVTSVPYAATMVGELYRNGYLAGVQKLVPRDSGDGYRSAVAWTVSRAALLREVERMRRALWRAENPGRDLQRFLTEDGYTFYLQADGTLTDTEDPAKADMTYASLAEMGGAVRCDRKGPHSGAK